MEKGDVVRIVRERVKRWSKSRLAKEANLSRTSLIDAESGVGEPRGTTWGALAEALGIPLSLLNNPPATEDAVVQEYTRLRKLDTEGRSGVQGENLPRLSDLKLLPHTAPWWKPETMKDAKQTWPRVPFSNDPDAFYIAASGHEMTGGGIEEDSFLLVHPNDDPRHGDLVLVRLGATASAVRRLHIDGRGRLTANPLHSTQTPVEVASKKEVRTIVFVGRITKVQ